MKTGAGNATQTRKSGKGGGWKGDTEIDLGLGGGSEMEEGKELHTGTGLRVG